MPKADFSLWTRENLERFARDAADENRELRADLQVALAGWRANVFSTLHDGHDHRPTPPSAGPGFDQGRTLGALAPGGADPGELAVGQVLRR